MELPPERIRDIAEKYLDKRPDEAEQPSGLYRSSPKRIVERFPCKPGLILNAMKGE